MICIIEWNCKKTLRVENKTLRVKYSIWHRYGSIHPQLLVILFTRSYNQPSQHDENKQEDACFIDTAATSSE